MANSINTNSGAQIALQALNRTNRELGETQNRINTGKNVSSAKDNGAIFAISTAQRAEQGALNSVKNSIQRGQSIVDVALAGGETIVEALEKQKALAVSIQSSAAGSAAETAYLADFNALGNEITKALAGSTFDGVNLFSNTAQQTVLTSTGATGNTANIGTGAAITVATAGGAVVRAGATAAIVDGAITAFTGVLGGLGSQAQSLERALTFTSKLQDSIETGIGNLVDADLAKESAKLTALQTKQQLGVQALSIANQSSSILLSLFR
ncbi:flagellin [Brevundimonas variabilis]|uniref:Flagellin n=1 Tax=Brevundimonas variabilis TaxID=74312 RepID=A0A7W9CIM8_9CAUL|nr:flagellin [Brevundimonas variabilis]MBB5746370.1 flagellin [Brevundimonas variabilis]